MVLRSRNHSSLLLLSVATTTTPTITSSLSAWGVFSRVGRGERFALFDKHRRRDDVHAASSSDDDRVSALYVHVPYCRRRCHYCDFAIVPVGDAPGEAFEAMDERYADALIEEIRSLPPAALRSVYFGGGTPSLAPASTLLRVLRAIRERHVVADDAEITLEADPGTFSRSKMRVLVERGGINRVSLGVQSTNDDVLGRVGRAHRRADATEAIAVVRDDGLDLNLSVDLISGLPGVDPAAWAETLSEAVAAADPDHVSVYDLQVEENTRFGRWYASSTEEEERRPLSWTNANVDANNTILPLPSPEDCAFAYKYTKGYLAAKGYEHYEISSYAKPGKRSRHNSNYWNYGSQWYAVGLGATDRVNGTRFVRPRRLSDYVDWVWDGRSRRANDDDDDDDDDILAETVMTRLRTADGLDLEWVRREHGERRADDVLRGAALGLELGLATLDDANTTLRLTDPEGFLFSNEILSDVFLRLE